MKVEYKDFIGVYQNVYPEGYCEHLISEFEKLIDMGAGVTRKQSENAHKHVKNDIQLNGSSHINSHFGERPTVRTFFDGLQMCFEHYSDEYSELKNHNIRATAMKIQRTDPGGGYHVWHSEQGNKEHSNRALVYSLYLNTLTQEEAGETEFLYQKRRINPEKNTMILWPAAYSSW
jgi:hypothetical protein